MSTSHISGPFYVGGMNVVSGALAYEPRIGKTFYVDPSAGQNGNSGEKEDDAFETTAYALTQCTAGRGDMIVLLGTETVTETVNFNVSRVTLVSKGVGVNPLVRGEYTALLADASFVDGPVGTVTAATRFVGVGFVSRDTDATFFGGAALLVGGAAAGAFGVHLLACRFPKWALDNRIGVAFAGGAAVSNCTVEYCDFEGVGASFDAGIYMQGACQNINILNNHFRQCTAAVQFGAFAGGGPHILMGHNVVEDGLTLDSQANTATGHVFDNWSELANSAAYDASVATLQGQGIQFSGNHYSE